MTSYRDRVHRTSRITAGIMAVAIILWGALIGAGHAFQSVLYTSLLVMIICLAIAATTRRKRATV